MKKSLDIKDSQEIVEEIKDILNDVLNPITKAIEVEIEEDDEDEEEDEKEDKEEDDEEISKKYESDNEEEDKWDNIQKACWKGYTQRGMKEKNGRKVPNCVPVEQKVDKATSPWGGILDPKIFRKYGR